MRGGKSEHVLPIFAGLWYDAQHGYNYEGYDACSVVLYTYNELTVTPQEQMPIPSNSSYCTWDYDNIEYYGNSTDMPSGFISGNHYDWEEILLDPNAAIKMTYQMNCKTAGGSIWTYNRITASPLYECPSNTRISWDNATRETGCTTTPIPCLADIVARDLNMEGFTFLAHVGLVAGTKEENPDIMQVLNNNEGIVFEPLYGAGSFSDVGEYWGERYGLEQQLLTRLPMDIAVDIINAGTNQKYYSFTYTCSWDYYPGGGLTQPDNCKFRCDSFVYYCYDVVGLKLQDSFTYLLTYPFVIFNDFMCSANPVESCFMPGRNKYDSLTSLNQDDDFLCVSSLQNNAKIINASSPALEIFSLLRPMLLTKSVQNEQLPGFVERYQQNANASIIELFVRCLCFELNKMSPFQIDYKIRPLLSDILWQHKYLSEDNFALTIMEKRLHFYAENPPCKWLNALITIKTETQEDKEEAMIAYIDQEDVVEQANLVSGSRLSSFQFLSQEKKCKYGKFFQHAYIHNESLSGRERRLLWLGLAEIKYPIDSSIQPAFKC